jgi:hypothetical protein
MPQSNPKQWGAISAMMTAHPDTCGRPRYLRGTIGWQPQLIDALTDSKGSVKAFLAGLYWLFPVLFGPKVIVCVTCNEMEFISPMARKLFMILHKVMPVEEESILFLDEDVQRMGEYADTLNLEYVGDENG